MKTPMKKKKVSKVRRVKAWGFFDTREKYLLTPDVCPIMATRFAAEQESRKYTTFYENTKIIPVTITYKLP